ncbi:hypothetical protein ACVWZZ_002179 [Bradyrhizobium sp. LM6.10]|jgi:hypothetical protein
MLREAFGSPGAFCLERSSFLRCSALMNPMDTFNPDEPCRLHDGVNNEFFDWNPEWAAHFREYSSKDEEGVIAWDGALLDGWVPV